MRVMCSLLSNWGYRLLPFEGPGSITIAVCSFRWSPGLFFTTSKRCALRRGEGRSLGCALRRGLGRPLGCALGRGADCRALLDVLFDVA